MGHVHTGRRSDVALPETPIAGGQRQRFVLARAILRDPDMLLLDEATSRVDIRTERLIHDSLADVVDGRITLAVAHCLSTVRHADQTLVFDDGKIVERGTHEGHLAADGVYAALWRVHVGETGDSGIRSRAGAAASDDA